MQFPSADAEKGMVASGISPDMSMLLIEMSTAINNALFAVDLPRTTENTTPTSIEAFADTFAAIFEDSVLKTAA